MVNHKLEPNFCGVLSTFGFSNERFGEKIGASFRFLHLVSYLEPNFCGEKTFKSLFCGKMLFNSHFCASLAIKSLFCGEKSLIFGGQYDFA